MRNLSEEVREEVEALIEARLKPLQDENVALRKALESHRGALKEMDNELRSTHEYLNKTLLPALQSRLRYLKRKLEEQECEYDRGPRCIVESFFSP